MKTTLLAAVAILTISIGAPHASFAAFHAPAHNFYQNNWIGS